MDDFEKYRKCSGQVLERDIKGEKFKFKPLKGNDLWKLLKACYSMQGGSPEDIMKNMDDEKLEIFKELSKKMLVDSVPDDILNEFVDYNLFDLIKIMQEINFSTTEAKDIKIQTKLDEMKKNATGANTPRA